MIKRPGSICCACVVSSGLVDLFSKCCSVGKILFHQPNEAVKVLNINESRIQLCGRFEQHTCIVRV